VAVAIGWSASLEMILAPAADTASANDRWACITSSKLAAPSAW